MNNIIIVDDDKDFVRSFVNELRPKGISVAPKNSLEGLKELLPSYAHKYAAVVLDIKCLLTDNQSKEDSSFIGAALKYLDTNISGFPRLILTGDETEFNDLKKYYPDENIYLKKPDHQAELIIKLNEYVSNAVPLRIKRENEAVFQVFSSGKMSANYEPLLIKILDSGIKEKDYVNFKGILADVRSFQEAIYKSINQRNKAVVPDRMFRGNGMPNFNSLMYHLSGSCVPPASPNSNVYQVPSIFYIANTIYWTCGAYIHEDPNRVYLISEYTLRSLINGLLEIILWSKSY